MKLTTTKISKKNEPLKGLLYINCTIKNTSITLCTIKNQDIKPFYKNSTKLLAETTRFRNNPYTLQKLATKVIKKFHEKNIHFTIIKIKGFGFGRYQLIKNLKKKLKISLIIEATPIPFNGCRPKKCKRK